MRVKHLTITLLLLLITGVSLFAQQRNCGSMEYLEFQKQNDPKRAAKMEAIEMHTREFINNNVNRITGTVTIPVVVHVVYNTTAENISDAQVQTQIDVLNEDFRRLNADADGTWPQAADSEIEFCLATVDPSGNSTTGITRTSTSVTAFSTNDNMKFNSSGGKDAWPAGDYLNLWVCDISGGILGYAQFPGGSPATDGVVIDYAYFGRGGSATPPFHLGRTATHEVGHWLNLRHIWGDGGCSVDDFVTDTPSSDGPNYGCAPSTVSCGTTDMVQNYMDYSDDACMNLYTAGQNIRMRALFDAGGARVSLLSSTACGSGNPPTCTDGIQNGSETGIDCGGPDCGACPTCSDGIQNGQETGVDCGGPSCSACPCTGTQVTVTIVLDNYPEETSWTLVNASGTTVGSGGTYGSQPDGSTVTASFCLADGCYDFNIFDAYGDGICCAYGNGSYIVTGGGNTLASGGSFGASLTTNFCLGGGPTPTCTDGIQNGTETGVDCGGSCTACPTCSDGIQNGDETGVDCGGSCPNSCGGGGCSYVNITSTNFDSNWGGWVDGGTDASRSANYAPYANSGSYCIRLRDNTSTSVMSTNNLNLTSYDEITVDFTYITVSMDNANEDFWLQISTNGGSTYTTVEEWNLNDEFVNNVREFDAVVIPGPFTSTTRLRFRCDASADNDLVYIDDVSITGCVNSARGEDSDLPQTEVNFGLRQPDAQTLNGLADFTLFPNPTRDQLTLSYNLPEVAQVQIMVTDFTGKLLQKQELEANIGEQKTTLDVSNLASGFYFVHLMTNGKVTSKKFVVAH